MTKKTPLAKPVDPPGPGGTYVYDEKLGRVVQVSQDIPKVASKGRKSAPGGCGEGACGQGACGDGPCCAS